MQDYRRLFRFAQPYYGLLVLSGIFMGIVALLDIFRLSAIVPVIDRIFTNKPINFSGSNLPGFVQRILSQLNAFSSLKVLSLLFIIIPIALIIRAIFEFLHTYIMSGVGQKVVRDTRNLVYEKLQNLSLDYFTQKRSGELVSRITNDVRLIENAVSYAVTDLVYQSFQVISCALLAFLINWRYALISLVLLPLVAVPMIRVGKVLRKLSKKSQEKMADINSLLVETFTGVRIVKAFCMEEREVLRFKGQNQDYYKLTMKSIKRTILLGVITELLGQAAALFIIFYGFKQVAQEKLSFGIFALFIAALLSLIRPFKKLSQVNSIIQQAMAAVKRIYEVLDIPPTIKEASEAGALPAIKEKIVFRNVDFSYGDRTILKNINLEVGLGTTLAVVGPSGVGKTTFVDLIPRFYDPTKGEVFMDSQDIKNVTLRSLRSQIGIVSQETILFNDTVRANIAYGKPKASNNEIEQAAIRAYAHEFILRLPQRYDTVIGDRGMRLSGGEKQRIAIARALLKNPPILILDEATSQLDSDAERIVQQALEQLIQGRTVFVIAHRLSTVKSASQIIVLDKGEIVERGTHQQLIEKNGLYKRYYGMQEFRA
ncbi:MAG: hypothetical protein A2984_01460 [Omnitrophica WOR_2 bacterium RIFCSPLOWO2_01_FULL_41_12]|nr:MAG: hypothetical protein A2984_01460 [Omnitrophica WOR_2 bacterium RIFCSPLOWO2_01_FULL_41_12]